MVIVGEKLNSSIPSVQEKLAARDADFVKDMTQRQLECGADYIDLNAGAFLSGETEMLLWMLEAATAVEGAKFMLDSPDYRVLACALERFPLENAVLNSVTLEKERFNGVLGLVKKYNTGVVALPMDGKSVPKTASERFEKACALADALVENGVPEDKIFIDALVEAVCADFEAARETVETIRLVREKYPNIHITGGLSNVSFGMPKRKFINSAFLAAAIYAGLDSGIMDITNPDAPMILAASQLVAGKDEYCCGYMEAYNNLKG
ncbi:MAG: dihydropteroate synthase [Clostridiales bacterium]|nr:dihydropteroate synthase [Clostridiales bacterium]